MCVEGGCVCVLRKGVCVEGGCVCVLREDVLREGVRESSCM